jgi:hypothetical protein
MSISIFVCDLGRDKPQCETGSCSNLASSTCTFELRGRLAGKTCGRRVCSKCGGEKKMCLPHQRVPAQATPKPI